VSRYEQRLADDKAEIRKRIAALGASAGTAVGTSVEALLAGDHARSFRLVLEDLPLNRESRSIDKACHAFVARHLPSAGHLRFVSAVLRMNVELERVGDYAVSIARQAVRLSAAPEAAIATEMTALAEKSCGMLRDALRAFATQDEELARETKSVSKSVGADYDRMYIHLTSNEERPVHDTAGLLTVFNKLERVTDQAKNICEETLFELLGETKPPKRYRVLFVDGRHSLIAPLAELLARKAFPESGHYASAGYHPADKLAPELLSFVDELGLEVGDLTPTKLDPSSLSQYHVVVWLNGDPSAHIPNLPYETVLLQWDLPKLADAKNVATRLREISRALSAEIRDLMVLIRGEDAS
jgi:phosphate transport system protein